VWTGTSSGQKIPVNVLSWRSAVYFQFILSYLQEHVNRRSFNPDAVQGIHGI
jgi:hypothetical protein